MNDDGSKTPFFITCADQPVFGFAGLWDSSRAADGVALESCTIITMPPNPLMAEVHNVKQRMPAILQSEDIDAWLAGPADEARAALKPYPADAMVAWPVSRRVNTPRNNHESLIVRDVAVETLQSNAPGEKPTVSVTPLDPGEPILE